VVEEGYELGDALQRTARAYDIRQQHARPSHQALRGAIQTHRALFRPQQLDQLQQQRRQALQAMRALSAFSPRLAGALIHGDGRLDRIRLMLHADTPEQVILHLHERHIPAETYEVLLHQSGGRRLATPAIGFVAGDSKIEIIVLDHRLRSDPPRDAISGGPIETLGAAQLERLL